MKNEEGEDGDDGIKIVKDNDDEEEKEKEGDDDGDGPPSSLNLVKAPCTWGVISDVSIVTIDD